MSDEEREYRASGNIISFIYKGNHYNYTVRTASEEDFVLDEDYLWNEGDHVSLMIPSEEIVPEEKAGEAMRKIRFSRKQLCIPYALFLFSFVVLPLAVIVYYAFTDGSGAFYPCQPDQFFYKRKYHRNALLQHCDCGGRDGGLSCDRLSDGLCAGKERAEAGGRSC